MKSVKPKKCRVCRFHFEPRTSLQVCCTPGCALVYAKKKQAEKRDKEAAKMRRDFYDNDVKTRKAAAKKACHEYIRERDKDKDCICCGEPLGGDFQAGHFLESGNNPKIRYHEDNIHGQRLRCNYFKGGNGGDYRGRLIEKIGVERVELLLNSKGGTMRRTAQDYKEIELYFKNKLKSIKEMEN